MNAPPPPPPPSWRQANLRSSMTRMMLLPFSNNDCLYVWRRSMLFLFMVTWLLSSWISHYLIKGHVEHIIQTSSLIQFRKNAFRWECGVQWLRNYKKNSISKNCLYSFKSFIWTSVVLVWAIWIKTWVWLMLRLPNATDPNNRPVYVKTLNPAYFSIT